MTALQFAEIFEFQLARIISAHHHKEPLEGFTTQTLEILKLWRRSKKEAPPDKELLKHIDSMISAMGLLCSDTGHRCPDTDYFARDILNDYLDYRARQIYK